MAAVGFPELVRLARAGELTLDHLWMAVIGTKWCRAAIKAGDVATAEQAQSRAVVCMLCPCRTDRDLNGREGQAHWCGKPLDERLDAALPTCGCFVAITVGGVTRPACATMVGSKKCPQARYS